MSYELSHLDALEGQVLAEGTGKGPVPVGRDARDALDRIEGDRLFRTAVHRFRLGVAIAVQAQATDPGALDRELRHAAGRDVDRCNRSFDCHAGQSSPESELPGAR